MEEQESDHFRTTKETTGRVLRAHIATLLRPPFSLHCLSCSIPRQTKLDFHHIPCIYLRYVLPNVGLALMFEDSTTQRGRLNDLSGFLF